MYQSIDTKAPATPVHVVELITNDLGAAAYFQAMMMQLGLRGHVRIEP